MQSFIVNSFAIGLILTGQAFAAPLELKHIAADAKWLVHVDVDAIRASTIAQRTWQKVLEEYPDAEVKLAFARALLGVDPTNDIHGITIYGKAIDRSEAITIVSASMNPLQITGLASVIPGRETINHEAYAIHSWKCAGDNQSVTVASAFRGREQLVIAGSIDDIKAALSVLDKKAPGLTADTGLGGSIPAGTTFLARAQQIVETKLLFNVPLIQQIDAAQLTIGENEGQLFVRTQVTMINPETAAFAFTAIRGSQALAVFLCPDARGHKYINAVHPEINGANVILFWSTSASNVWGSFAGKAADASAVRNVD